MGVIIARGERLYHSLGLLAPIGLAQQPEEGVEGVPVSVGRPAAQLRVHAAFPERSVQSTACVDIRESALCQFREPSGAGEQVHVPEMVVMPVVINGVALGVGLYQRDGLLPVLAVFCGEDALVPLH
ncbi:hypothetical protein BJP40_31065 [Streptomyces sp. CC53]|nr:hypothetical protein BJP40_31065 [Streptomyces sp. CC53]OII67118.1 hypothetical protein BJP39_25985 [Streptomyces sp. CC77]